MPESGTRVRMPGAVRLALRGLGYFTWPLQIDDYFSLINPLWSTEELRGRIERIHHETEDAVTVFVIPVFAGPGINRASISELASTFVESDIGELIH